MKNILIITFTFLLITVQLKAQELKLVKPAEVANHNMHDMFGWQIAHGKDFLFASAPFEENGARDAGRIYIYKKTEGGQVFHQALTISDSNASSRFGLCMAHAGNYIVASTMYPITTGAGKGNLHLFKLGAENKWELVNSFNSDTSSNFTMPSAIAMDGKTIVVSGGSNLTYYPNGSITIFKIADDNSVAMNERITIPNLGQKDIIGRKVAIHNNLLAFSCITATGAVINSGAVWVYRYDGSSWKFLSKLFQPDGAAYDKFGSSIAIDYPVVAVGAMRQGTNTTNGKKCGAVYVFRLNDNGFTTEAKLSADFAANNYDYFGTSVSVHKDILAVGSSADDFAGDNTGAVYVFQRYGNSWQQVNKLIGSNVNDYAFFGHSVSVYEGDVLCSAHLEETDSGAEDHGAVYLYKNAKNVVGIASQTAPNGEGISLYPNPAGNQFTLHIPAVEEVEQIVIYDIRGSEIMRFSNGTGIASNTLSVDCAKWEAGIYIVSIKGKTKVENLRVVKQ